MKNIILALVLFAFILPCAAQSTTLSIAEGGTTSTALTTDSGARWCTLSALIIPAGWTGGTSVTFLASADGTNFYAVKDQYGSAVTATVAANTYVALSPSEMWAARAIKIVAASATSRAESPIAICR